MKILTEIYLLTKKPPLNFGSRPIPDAGTGPDALWQRSALPVCSC